MRKTIIICLYLLVIFIWNLPVVAQDITLSQESVTSEHADTLQIELQMAGQQKEESDSVPADSTAQNAPQDLSEADSQKEEEKNPAWPVTLSIDNQNVYEGMKKAYKNGYMPSIQKGKAILVVPLVADGEMKDNMLTASIDLGTTEQSPFLFQNYQKTILEEEKQIGGTDEKRKIYYIRFDLALAKNRYNGSYPVTVSVTGKDLNGNEVTSQFTVYITITDGINGNREDGSSADLTGTEIPEGEVTGSAQGENPSVPEPIVLVKGCALNPTVIHAGESFTAAVTLKNTNVNKAVQNMVVTVEYDSEQFTFLDASETIYVAKLDRDSSMDLPLHFRVNRNAQEGNYKITLTMNYDNSEAVPLSSSGFVSIPVKQRMEVQLKVPQIAKSVTEGDTLPLEFQVLNLGRSRVYNVRCDMEGDGLVETGTAFIGNLEGGTDGTAAMNLFISAKGQKDSEKYGKTDGRIIMTYEDTDGKEYTQEFPFETTIQKPVVSSETAKKEKEKPAGQWWISILIIAVLTAATGAAYRIRQLGR